MNEETIVRWRRRAFLKPGGERLRELGSISAGALRIKINVGLRLLEVVERERADGRGVLFRPWHHQEHLPFVLTESVTSANQPILARKT